ncbi:MAG TPA: histidine kinase [Terriglobia bacterium]|nr:histidine kinase [Terriglobia bacterium]
MDPRLNSAATILVTLLIKLGLIASLASIVARAKGFKRLLFIEQRTPKQKLLLAVVLGVPFSLGVLARILGAKQGAGYQGADATLEITVVAGLIGGTIVALTVGMMVSLPALLIPHPILGIVARFPYEQLAVPMVALYAVVAGTARWVCPDKEEIWKFSPFIDRSLYRSIQQRFRHPGLDWQLLLGLICVVLELARMTFGRMAPHQLFFLSSPNPWTEGMIVLATLIGVGLPLRIWNNTRIERKLEEQERLLMQARVDALISQINPHFLFNTLNTVSSLIRFDPDTARTVLLKLSNILRRRLKTQVHFVPLRQELDFIDDYLDIEIVRFGRDKIHIAKEIDPDTLEMLVPSMILQPLVENAIRHGIGPKIDGGTITLRASRQHGRLVLGVIDDGIGIPPERLHEVYASGIGISNVHERLKVLYGHECSLKIDSQLGEGTAIRFEIPELATAEAHAVSEPAPVAR